jgi:nucleoid-associated protein YgaU
MRVVSIVAAIAVVALIALTLVPEASAYHAYLSLAALAVAGLLLLAILLDRRGKAEPRRAVAEAAKPPAVAAAPNQADAEVVSFLAALQEKGRLVDFLMDDLTAYGDAQVGAAARVVHEGCRAVLREHFSIRPVREDSEGSAVTVAAGYAADEYRLVGKIRGEAPFSGTLVHRGWKTERVKLPRVIRSGDRLPTIAPAEVELK